MIAYEHAIRSVAAQVAHGRDVEQRIDALAKCLGVERTNIVHDVTEMVDLLKN